MDKQELLSLIDGGLSMRSGQAQVDEPVAESTDEVAEEPTDSDHAMMRELAKSFIEAHRSGALSPQDAGAYDTLFKYFGRNK